MKRILLCCMALLALLSLTGCNAISDSEAEDIPFDVEIKEKMFIAQTNEIYVNVDDYLGKLIKLEGMFFSSYDEENDTRFSMVIRFGPGCCGDDGNAGFEVWWDDASGIKLPQGNDWVEAVGALEWYTDPLDGNDYLRLNLTSLRILPTRGAETVLQ